MQHRLSCRSRLAPQAPRTARLVVPFPAGGETDGLARLWVPGFSQRIGLPVVVDNRPGAGGVPAADVVAKAAPDGLTLLLATSSIGSTGPAVNPALPYDVERDFTPLSLLAVSPSLVLISTTVPAQTLEGRCHENGRWKRTGHVGSADAADLLRSPPVPAGGHPARGLVVRPVHARLP